MDSTFVRDFRKPLLALLVLGSVFLAAATVSAIASWGDDDKLPANNLITVTGKGEALAVPDIAVFNFSVIEEGKTVAEAQKKSTDKSKAVLDYLKGQNIAERDIKTTSYYINPKYEYPQQAACLRYPCPPVPEPKLVGYEVSQSVQVKVRDTAQAGTLLSGIGSYEVKNVSGIDFQIDDEEAVKADARKMAIDDAKTQAKELADQLGVRLGKIVSFSESGNYPIYYAREAYGKGGADMAVTNQAAPAPELPAGENSVVSNVTITYEIK